MQKSQQTFGGYVRNGRRGFLRYAVLAAASLVIAVDYRTFVEWGSLYPGGATGLSLLLQRICQTAADAVGMDVRVPFSPFNIILNAIPAWIGFKYVGRRFTARSIYVILLTAVFTDILPMDAILSFVPAQDIARLRSDPVLSSIFGGLVFGFGMSLCLRWNATTGGTDFIAIYLSEKKGKETWNLILAFNAVILLSGGFFSGWAGSFYSIIYQFVAVQVVHVMYRTYQYQTLMIVTTKPGKVCEAIHRISHHGATIVDAKGAANGMKTSLVMSVVAADDTASIYALCKSLDQDAFINTISTSRVIGRFYLRPRD